MSENWQLYAQQGVNGTEYGIRIRPGYIVVGFQKEDAEEIIRLHDEVERLRSDQDAIMAAWDKDAVEHDARINGLEAEAQEYHDKKEEALTLCAGQNRYIERLEAAFLKAETELRIYQKLCPNRSWENSAPRVEYWSEQEAREALERIRSGKDEN